MQKKFISDKEINEAARVLYDLGCIYGWWPKSVARKYEDLDEIGREEFAGIVELVISAAATVKSDC